MCKLPTATRRALVLAAPGLALSAASAMTSLNAQGYAHTASPQFLEYRRRYFELCAIFSPEPRANKHFQYSDPSLQEAFMGSKAWGVLEDARTDAMWEAIEILLARPVRTLNDVVELGLVVADQLYTEQRDGSLVCDGTNGQLEPAFMSAVLSLAKGGVNVAA